MLIKTTDNFTVECLGIIEDYVYDIEVENNHNFFGNNICVHNSAYINFNEFVRQNAKESDSKEDIVKIIDEFSENVIQPLMDKTYEALRAKLNAPRQEMVMKREDIADKGIWTGKKRYILQVLNSEGIQYKEPKIKIKGIECVKSSTPMICRNMIKDSIKIILNENEKNVQDYIQKCYEKFKASPVEDIAFPRGISNIDKYISESNMYTKGTPIHVRSAILHNHYLKKYNVDSKYQEIRSGDKVKFIYLKVPNTIRENVMGFIDVLPEEFNIHQYIDYETQFEKAFVAPIQSILDTVKWKWKYREPINTLDKFLIRRK